MFYIHVSNPPSHDYFTSSLLIENTQVVHVSPTLHVLRLRGRKITHQNDVSFEGMGYCGTYANGCCRKNTAGLSTLQEQGVGVAFDDDGFDNSIVTSYIDIRLLLGSCICTVTF